MAVTDKNVQAALATNRFGLGARPGELREAADDPRGWLAAQLGGGPPIALDGAGSLTSGSEALAGFFKLRALRQAMRQEEQAGMGRAYAAPGDGKPKDDVVASIAGYTRPIYLAEVAARTTTAVRSTAPLLERLVWFWSNHFTVSAAKVAVAPVAGAFEREAIRPHVLGRFGDMLQAVVHHPAMILYLDNARSFGADSRRGRRAGGGLNENLGRELLELHTVGVDAGYTQRDVTTFAQALTGWTINPGRRKPTGVGEFWYVGAVHEPGSKTVMGRTYPDTGEGQAEAILRDLAGHPATARHVAGKLARHFVADDPPAGAVDRLARRFLDTGGDLREVTAELVSLDAAWDPALRKMKSPNEFVVSALRGLDAPQVEPRIVVASLDSMGQRPFFAPSPAGWPDTVAAWAGPDGVYKRIEWSVAVGEKAGPKLHRADGLARSMLGGLADDGLMTALSRAESGAQAVAMLLSSPQFQRR
ncbi:MAG: DUF1800 family protein [Alphaproteobacteria bacterium]|nr:DUF1800 family protein [Alphaproteobacteria bacterium]